MDKTLKYFIALLFIAQCGHSQLSSLIVTSKGGSSSTVATPTDSPGQNTYGVSQNVTLSDATAGSTICYTTDGSTPGAATPGTCDSSPTQTYSSPFLRGVTTTVKAIGTKSASTNSSALTSVYTVTSALGPADSYMNCNTSSPGTTLTTTILNNCTQGNGNLGGWTLSSTITGVTVSATAHAMPGSTLVNGVLFPTSTTSQSISVDHTAGGARYWQGAVPAGFRQITLAGWITYGPTQESQGSAGLFDYLVTFSAATAKYAALQLNDGNCGGAAVYGLNIETNRSGTTHSSCLAITPGATYWTSLTNDYNAGTTVARVYDTSFALVGTISDTMSTGEDIQSLRIGQNETHAIANTSVFENFLISFSGQASSPIGPVTSTLPGSVYFISKIFNTSALSGSSTTTVSPSVALLAGQTNAVFVTMENASATVSGCTDTAGNTYTQAATVNLATQGHAEIWVAPNTTANAANVVTCTHTASTFRGIIVNSIGGANTSTPVDTGHTATGTQASGADVTTGSFTPSTSTGSVLACGYITSGVALTPGTNYAGINTNSTTSSACEFRPSAPSSSQTASLIQSNTSSKWMIAVPLKQ